MADSRADRLLVSEIYRTIQGESSLVGYPTVFVRLFSCNLRCVWCDAMHAVEGGEYEEMSAEDVARRVRELAGEGIYHVCWTGGEPLLQWRQVARTVRLLPDHFVHSIETDGEVPVEPSCAELRDRRAKGLVRFIMDVKCPGSGMTAKLATENLRHLRPEDEVKFVVLDRADYEFARRFLEDHAIPAGTILFSPATPAHKVNEGLAPADLAVWLLEDGLNARLQIQVHKIVWPGKDRGI
jgi:7-carboxy-7-deazaguanine synthase